MRTKNGWLLALAGTLGCSAGARAPLGAGLDGGAGARDDGSIVSADGQSGCASANPPSAICDAGEM